MSMRDSGLDSSLSRSASANYADGSAIGLRDRRGPLTISRTGGSAPLSCCLGRSVALDHHTVAALRAHRARQAQERLALGPAYTDDDLVFAHEDGSAPHPERLSKVFADEARNAGLPVIRFHDLRHTYATIALQAGVHIKVVSERLGHGDIALTLNIYSHAIPALEEAAADRVADVFGTA